MLFQSETERVITNNGIDITYIVYIAGLESGCFGWRPRRSGVGGFGEVLQQQGMGLPAQSCFHRKRCAVFSPPSLHYFLSFLRPSLRIHAWNISKPCLFWVSVVYFHHLVRARENSHFTGTKVLRSSFQEIPICHRFTFWLVGRSGDFVHFLFHFIYLELACGQAWS